LEESSPAKIAKDWLETALAAGSYGTASRERLAQLWGLATLYVQLNGPMWTNNSGWMDRIMNECSWQGIRCNGSGMVQEIHQTGKNLTQNIPPEILVFAPTLKVLDLSGNALGGTIPTSIGALHALEELYLSSNSLTGSVPATIGSNMTQLKILRLHQNQGITGPFPDTVLQMTNLDDLTIYHTSIASLTPGICQLGLSNLEVDCASIGFAVPCVTQCWIE
jgi:Leucine rich repeat